MSNCQTKRSPWFNARTEPPVNGGLFALYEHRCKSHRKGVDWSRARRVEKGCILMVGSECTSCQWRGLLREDGGKA